MPTTNAARRPVIPEGEETDAPGDLGVVEAFLNTIDLADPEHGEQFPTPDALTAWMRRYGLLSSDEAVGDSAELARALRLREALRELLHANHDDVEPPPDAYAVLAGEASSLPVTMRFGPDGAGLSPLGHGIDGALAALLTIVLEAIRDGSWRRLKACRSSTCRWAFWDGSRNRSGKWCDMATCGNRTKVRNYRQRHAAE